MRLCWAPIITLILVGSTHRTLAEETLPDTWAFEPVQEPSVPHPGMGEINPIDAFIFSRLKEGGLEPSASADRATLIRRLCFDLTGLPPRPEQIERFLRDESPDAYEKLVDRLLASPAFGERAALFWLDLVRFAESDGFKADDPRPTAWRYRDYVIRSFNADKPYDRFIREQIAGDELYPRDADALIATSLHRHYPDEFNAINCEQRRQEILNDVTDTTSAVFLGLSLGCAKCHDHKFDPIPQRDYYRFQAFFAGWWPVDVPVLDSEERAEYEAKRTEWERKTSKLRAKMRELEEPYRQQYSKKKRFRFPPEYAAMTDIPFSERTPFEKQIAAMVEAQVNAPRTEVLKLMNKDEDVKSQWEKMNNALKDIASRPPEPPRGMIFTDVGPQAPPTHLLKQGNWRNPGDEVQPGYLTVLGGETATITPREQSTGRRTALANWLTSPENPLTARVMVNRLWQRHFGRGIVSTPSDFGAQGSKPSHPALLDWLATEFIRTGWSLKHMHRLMVTSGTYRQANAFNDAAYEIDPENRLLWRMNRQRLEGETLRDTILAVNGTLNPKMQGPSIFPELPKELVSAAGGKWKVTSNPVERDRRSIYVFVKRNLRYPLFRLFDATDRTETCARRFATTSAPQSLMLLNDELILREATTFADRVIAEVGEEPNAVIERASLLGLGRQPSSDERRLMMAFLDRHPGRAGVIDLCHAIFNLNEFIYVD